MSWLNSKWISHPWIYIYRFALWEHFFGHSDFWHACRARSLGCQALNCSPSLLLATIHQRFPRRRNMDRKSVYSTGGYPSGPLQNGNSIWKATLKNWRPVSCWTQIISAHVWHYLSTYCQTWPKSGGKCHPLPKMSPMSFIQVRDAENKW